ncbi:uncharacterized protein I206_101340 [Kwoniella pini CBS 10737]|uniref:Choline transporter n=1 Tax=Kwoniella pini CBS 10737 TaxID=1296096 RepID=A0A1B9HWY7_9TREE|nr:uncharacterized protein I206_06692 [Kwoniella pini CBS 10737]OCF47785.1 hypothetical protein I206_06692 [Kwoniella pini CBS 10737]
MTLTVEDSYKAGSADKTSLPEEMKVKEIPLESGQDSNGDIRPLDKHAFTFWSVFSLAFSCINSWVALVVSLSTILTAGGPTAVVYGFIYATICTMANVLSHGEMFAVFPTAGGQYHWAAMLSPPKARAAISWATGMSNVIGLWLGIAAAAYLCTNMVASIILVNNPDFILTPGKQYGIFIAMTMFAPLSALGVGSKANRRLDLGLMVLSIVGSVVIVVTLLAKASPRASGSFVFASITNETGWNSPVIAWLIGLLPSTYAFVGFDIVYHVSEELPNAKREGPKAANWTILFSGVSAWIIVVCILFAISDVGRVLGTGYGLPFAQICMDATNSKAATTIFILILLIVFSNATRGNTISAGRTLMAFARDGMLPYGSVFMTVKLGEPIYGIIISVVIALLVGLVQFGPAAAFNSLTGGSTIFFFISYTIPCACMLFGGRKRLNKLFPDRQHNLGKWGIICNLISIFFVIQSLVIYVFPAARPVTPDNMNYVIVFAAFFGVVLVALWHGYAKKRYHGPRVRLPTDQGDPIYEE